MPTSLWGPALEVKGIQGTLPENPWLQSHSHAQCQEFSAECLYDNLWGWRVLMFLFSTA